MQALSDDVTLRVLVVDDQDVVRQMGREPELRAPLERPLASLLQRPVSWDESADAVTAAVEGHGHRVARRDLAATIRALATRSGRSFLNGR